MLKKTGNVYHAKQMYVDLHSIIIHNQQMMQTYPRVIVCAFKPSTQKARRQVVSEFQSSQLYSEIPSLKKESAATQTYKEIYSIYIIDIIQSCKKD